MAFDAMSKQQPDLIKKGIQLAKEFQTALVDEGKL